MGKAALPLLFVVLFAAPAAAQTLSAEAARGRDLAFDRSKGNCLSCHVMAGGELPGGIGPPLEGVKARFPNEGDLRDIIFDETKRNPQTVMPPFGRNLILNEAEINAIVAFLQTL